VSTILQKLHGGIQWGHFSSNIIMQKIMDVGYWWPTMNRDVHEYCRTCDQCQRTSNLFGQNWLPHYLKNHFKNGDWILLDLLNLQPSWGHVWTPTEKMFFNTRRMLHPIFKPLRLKFFNFRGQSRIWRSFWKRLLLKLMVVTILWWWIFVRSMIHVRQFW